MPFPNPTLDPLSPRHVSSSSGMSPSGSGPVLLSPEGSLLHRDVPGNSPRGLQGAGLPLRAAGAIGAGAGGRTSDGSGTGPRTTKDLKIDLGCLQSPESRGLSIEAVSDSQGASPTHHLGHHEIASPRLPGKEAQIAGSAAAAAAIAPGPGTSPPLANGQLSASPRAANGAAAAPTGAAAPPRPSNGYGHGSGGVLSPGTCGEAEDLLSPGILSDDEGAGPTSGGAPISPTTRRRQQTFGATLDFIEALCDGSSSLTSYTQVGFGGGKLAGTHQDSLMLERTTPLSLSLQ